MSDPQIDYISYFNCDFRLKLKLFKCSNAERNHQEGWILLYKMYVHCTTATYYEHGISSIEKKKMQISIQIQIIIIIIQYELLKMPLSS